MGALNHHAAPSVGCFRLSWRAELGVVRVACSEVEERFYTFTAVYTPLYTPLYTHKPVHHSHHPARFIRETLPVAQPKRWYVGRPDSVDHLSLAPPACVRGAGEKYDIPDEAAGASFLAFGSSAPEIVIGPPLTPPSLPCEERRCLGRGRHSGRHSGSKAQWNSTVEAQWNN